MKVPVCHPDRKYYAKGFCKVCYDKDKWIRLPHKQNPVVAKRKNVRRKFDLSLDAYEALIAAAKVCGMCGKPFGAIEAGLDPVLDHDHQTKKVREVIHRRCNAALGLLYDDVLILAAGIVYLRRHQ
jgi:hypothetical protein